MLLGAELAREQRAFLRRDRQLWAGHLGSTRGFLGEALAEARGPAVILGAGSGLEVPWALAPAGTVGWDADPWSRLRTLLRHRRWAPWVFEDLTGGTAELAATARRATAVPWSGQPRPSAKAVLRLAGLMASLQPEPRALRAWLETRRPGTVLAANVMGQFGVVAQRLVEGAFGAFQPWVEDPERRDPLAEALEAWTARCVRAFLRALADCPGELCLVHDRGVVFGEVPVTLGPFTEPWQDQLRAEAPLEVADALAGVDVLAAFQGRTVTRHQRWLWPVAPGQMHLVEGLRVAARERC